MSYLRNYYQVLCSDYLRLDIPDRILKSRRIWRRESPSDTFITCRISIKRLILCDRFRLTVSYKHKIKFFSFSKGCSRERGIKVGDWTCFVKQCRVRNTEKAMIEMITSVKAEVSTFKSRPRIYKI